MTADVALTSFINTQSKEYITNYRHNKLLNDEV